MVFESAMHKNQTKTHFSVFGLSNQGIYLFVFPEICDGLRHQSGSQNKLAFFLIPESVSHRNKRIKNFPIPVCRKREKETGHEVSIEAIGAIIGGIIVQFRTKFKMPTGFFNHGIVNGKKKCCPSKKSRTAQTVLKIVISFQAE